MANELPAAERGVNPLTKDGLKSEGNPSLINLIRKYSIPSAIVAAGVTGWIGLQTFVITEMEKSYKAGLSEPEHGLRMGVTPEWTAYLGVRRASITSETRDLRTPGAIRDAIALMQDRGCFDVRITTTNEGEIRANILKTPANQNCH